ncbi:MAG: IS66 family transposase [Chloroflexota bacterium]
MEGSRWGGGRQQGTMGLTREEIGVLYAAGVAAVSVAVEQLQAVIAGQQEQIAALSVRVKELEDRAKTTSRTSSKPPASDGYQRPPRSLRQRSGKGVGGQPGHEGSARSLVAEPDQVIRHRPAVCATCQGSLDGVEASGYERRQVVDLPPLRLEVAEHRAEAKTCPRCQQVTRGAFPAEVTTTVQYGAGIKALAVYLLTYHLVPYERTSRLLGDLFGHAPAKGTLQTAVETCAAGLAGVEEHIADALRAGAVLHNDETGVRVAGKLHWVHVASTARLTHYGVRTKRGSAAMTAIGILPGFQGTSVHDGLAAYRQYGCQHALCNAHHLRELTAIEEHDKQPWATEMKDLLGTIKRHIATAQVQGETRIDDTVGADFVTRYQAALAAGYAANPPPTAVNSTRRGRPKQSKARNLLDRLRDHQDAVLAFMTDWRVPFDNNQAERDLRMIKVQQKVSGCFRTPTGAAWFCRVRGYLSTLAKQGQRLLPALQTVFAGQPLLPNLSAG